MRHRYNFRICFVQNGNKLSASFIMRAHHIINYWNSIGKHLNIKIKNFSNVIYLEKCYLPTIFIFVKPKRIRDNIYLKLKELHKNAIILIDCVDAAPFRKMVSAFGNKCKNGIDGIIFPNNIAKNVCIEKFPDMFSDYDILLYHHGSTPNSIEKKNNLSFCYYGNKLYKIEVSEIKNIFSTKKSLEVAAQYHCHASFRNYIYKPNTKISVSANCASNIVINKSSGGVDSLPFDYSYICDDTEQDFIEMIYNIKSDFESKNWFRNLEIMEWYKNEYSIENICKTYLKHIEKISLIKE